MTSIAPSAPMFHVPSSACRKFTPQQPFLHSTDSTATTATNFGPCRILLFLKPGWSFLKFLFLSVLARQFPSALFFHRHPFARNPDRESVDLILNVLISRDSIFSQTLVDSLFLARLGHFFGMARDRNAAQASIAQLLTKINDPDPDIRFMQLSDLTNILLSPASDYLRNDTHAAARIIEGLLKALADQHGEVQNQALKWCVSVTEAIECRTDTKY